MRILHVLIIGAFLTLGLFAQGPSNSVTIQTIDGKKYQEVVVKKVEPDGIQIAHSEGVATLKFTNLPEDLRKQYGYDPQKVAALWRAQAEQVRADQAAREAERVEKINKAQKSIREVESDLSKYAKGFFYLTGDLDVSTYYNWGYAEAQETHFSFEIRDSDGKTAHLYLEKASGLEIRKKVLAAGPGGLKARCLVSVIAPRFEPDAGEVMVELFKMEPLQK